MLGDAPQHGQGRCLAVRATGGALAPRFGDPALDSPRRNPDSRRPPYPRGRARALRRHPWPAFAIAARRSCHSPARAEPRAGPCGERGAPERRVLRTAGVRGHAAFEPRPHEPGPGALGGAGRREPRIAPGTALQRSGARSVRRTGSHGGARVRRPTQRRRPALAGQLGWRAARAARGVWRRASPPTLRSRDRCGAAVGSARAGALSALDQRPAERPGSASAQHRSARLDAPGAHTAGASTLVRPKRRIERPRGRCE